MLSVDPKAGKAIEIRDTLSGDMWTITPYFRQGEKYISLAFEAPKHIRINNTGQQGRKGLKDDSQKQL